MNDATIGRGACPDCGATLHDSGALAGLCPRCLLSLGDHAAADAASEPLALPALSEPAADPPFQSGSIIAQRYRLVRLLGRGGMGEVWHAFDFKLRLDVALKRLRPDVVAPTESLEVLRREVRAARQIVSLHVCRVFDLITDGEHEMISMEYIEGTTLAALLAARSPLPLTEATEIASQFLAGLDAIHRAGLVHRDVKPENIMITSSHRVVLMDFGLAKASSGWHATTGGTPAYMPPETGIGPLTAAADVFAAGIVLAEMALAEGARSAEARQRLWRALRGNPGELSDYPWRSIVARAVAPEPEARYQSAGELARALEAVRVQSGASTARNPFPGLVSFGEEDAEFFFGREFEVEVLLRDFRSPRLRAIVGPSGAGKSSFVRAGLVPALPGGWSAAVCTPGDQPVAALAECMPRAAAGGGEADRFDWLTDDARLVEIASWFRRQHEQAIVIVDQFEELFTLNDADMQSRFSQLLSRLVLDADVHVVICLRDDFLLRCQAFEALHPIFSAVTPLGAPTGNALRRALVQPALRAGCRFEDDRLVDDILAEVAGERGALPLLAFAAARLWDERDRTTGTITRAAYQALGGVGGALAQHAEAVLERIGPTRAPVVRELFRNLVTGEGTRAVQDRDELLSIFSAPALAGEVLRQFVDARLLTSFERPADGTHARKTRVEIIHESLLTAWPRLVRWREEDADTVRFRNQLRQSARLWDERGRPMDLLWTGTAFKAFEVWKEQYTGGLTTIEDAFARAIIQHAGRRRSQRRMVLGATMTLLVAVMAVFGKLWVDTRRAEGQARSEALRAEAQQLFALGQVELDRNPTAALAFALAALERSDTRAVRQFAVQALWRGPTALILDDAPALADWRLDFSPDGAWLAVDRMGGEVWLWHQQGGMPRKLAGDALAGFTGDSRYVVTTSDREVRVYDVRTGELARRIAGDTGWGIVRGHQLITATAAARPGGDGSTLAVHVRSLPDGEPRQVGVWSMPLLAPRPLDSHELTPRPFDVDTEGRFFYVSAGGNLSEISLSPVGPAGLRNVLRTSDPILGFKVHPSGERVFTWHQSGAVQVRSTSDGRVQRQLQAPAVTGGWRVADISRDGRWLASANGNDQTVHLWDLAGPPDAGPLVLRRGEVSSMSGLAFHPSGDWLAAQDHLAVTVWPLAREYPAVLRGPGDQLYGVAFGPDGRWVASGAQAEPEVWIWPMTEGEHLRVLNPGAGVSFLEAAPTGDLLAASTPAGVRLLPLDGGATRTLPGFDGFTLAIGFDREGRRVVGGANFDPRAEAALRVWDLKTGQVHVLDAIEGQGYISASFLPDGRLLTGGFGGLRLWNATLEGSTLLGDGPAVGVASSDGRHVMMGRGSGIMAVPLFQATVYDLETGRQWTLATHGDVAQAAWNRAGTRVVTSSREGIVRVGPFTGEEPHLLFGHRGSVWGVAVDANDRWIASAGEDRTVHLWPMPEGQPFHTLPHADLLERLRSLTSYRAMPDATTPTGFRLTAAPFQGWNQMPPGW